MESNWRFNVWQTGMAGFPGVQLMARLREIPPVGRTYITNTYFGPFYLAVSVVPGQPPVPFVTLTANPGEHFPYGNDVDPDH